MTRTREENAADLAHEEDAFNTKLGPCCMCGGETDVTTIIMLDREAPEPGTGWGCVVCGLPNNGAVAVVCESCIGRPLEAPIGKVCKGYPVAGERIGLAEYPFVPFAHIVAMHDADEGDEVEGRCTNPNGHSWVEGPPDRGDEGPIRCEYCGADGDA